MRPGSQRDKIVELAEDQHGKQGLLELDGQANISESENNGAWVSAWVWVDFSDTELDKEEDDET